jgi:hypothetical protein
LPRPVGWTKLERHPGKQTMRFLLRRGALLGAGLLASLPARAEMLQFPTPDGGMKSWPKLETITDWHQDQETSMKLAANVIIPDGVDPATAEMKIEARGFPRNGRTLAEFVSADQAANAGATVQKQADIYDRDKLPFVVVTFAPATGGSWKTVGYAEEGDILLAFTLVATSKTTNDKGMPIFTDVIHKYAKDIPW